MITSFSFGTVVGNAFTVLFRNLIPFMFLSLVITAPTLLYDIYGPEARTVDDQRIHEAIANLIDFICSTLLTATLVYGTVQELRGQHASLGASIGRGLTVILPAIGLSIVIGIGVAIGFVLLIVPGLILLTIWWVAVPVTVVERPGVFASLGRSAELTKGFRWPIFGIIILFVAAAFAILYLLSIILVPMVLRGSLGVISFFIITWVVLAFFSALTSVIAGVGYFALRSEKEGADLDQIAAVFD